MFVLPPPPPPPPFPPPLPLPLPCWVSPPPFSRYERNLYELVSILQNDAQFKGQIVWITSPTRVYKSAGGHPGECRCPGGKSYSCGRSADAPHCLCQCGMLRLWMEEDVLAGHIPDTPREGLRKGYAWFPSGAAYERWIGPNRRPAGRLGWEGMEGPIDFATEATVSMPLVHNTFDRVKWANERAAAIMQQAFPGKAHIVDFAALTDGLTPEYCFDGLHWSCEENHMHERAQFPWHCKNLANAAVTNILANVLCSIP
eukprot:jgi/Mesvir1/28772/Mv19737-RA.1